MAGTYTLTPSEEGYTFSPISRMVQVSGDVTGQDFTATVDATAATPLIFIPGIMGSKLRIVQNDVPGTEVWPGRLVDQVN